MNLFSGLKGQALRGTCLGPSDPRMLPALTSVLGYFRISPPRTPDVAAQRIKDLGFRVSITGSRFEITGNPTTASRWPEAFDIIREEGLL